MSTEKARTNLVGAPDGKAFTRRDIERVTAAMRKGAGGALGVPETGTGDVVEHICPDCGGGQMTNTQAGLIVVQTCATCGGRGVLSDDELFRRYG
jgi:hypothetical protein